MNNKYIMLDYKEYLDLERTKKCHEENIELLEGKIIIPNEDYVEYKTLQEKLDKILTYAKKQCENYLKEDDCEYCDGVFASCRKVLQLSGEDISEYE